MAKSTFTPADFGVDRHLARKPAEPIPKTPEELEHILGENSLLAYLEPVADQRYLVGKATNPQTRESHSDIEIRNRAKEIHQRVKNVRREKPLVHELPVSRGKELAQFHMGATLNIWDYEPQLLDDLHRAKILGDQEAINYLRGINRAGSWTTHKRVNEAVALQKAQRWLENLSSKEATSPKFKQVEALVRLFSKDICGIEAEPVVSFIEDELEQKWRAFCKEFATQSHGVKKKPLWPEALPFSDREHDARYIEPGFEKLAMLQKQIITLRELRDQATYHLLNKKLCEFIPRQDKQKHVA